MSLNKGSSTPNTSNQDRSHGKPDMATTSIQVHEASLIGLDKMGVSLR